METFMNTANLCDYGYPWHSPATRIFINFEMFISVKHYVNLSENIMNMNNWTIHAHMSVPEHSYEFDKPWSCFHELSCVIRMINMYSYTTCSIYEGVNKY